MKRNVNSSYFSELRSHAMEVAKSEEFFSQWRAKATVDYVVGNKGVHWGHGNGEVMAVEDGVATCNFEGVTKRIVVKFAEKMIPLGVSLSRT